MAVDREFVYIIWPWSRAQTWSWDLGPWALDPGLALGTRAWTLGLAWAWDPGLGLGPWTLAWLWELGPGPWALGWALGPLPWPGSGNLGLAPGPWGGPGPN